jgi:hypothetical protein
MRFAIVGVLLITALLTNGCRNDTRRSIRAGDPNLEDVPPGNYPEDDLGLDPSKWTWVKVVGRPIEDVVVIPPLMLKDPYRMGEDKDFYGAIEGDTVRIQFKTGGVYVVKIVYQDRSIPPEIRIVYVAAAKGSAK